MSNNKKLWLVIIIITLLMGSILLKSKINGQPKQFGAVKNGYLVDYYSIAGNLVKRINLKNRKIKYFNKNEEFISLYENKYYYNNSQKEFINTLPSKVFSIGKDKKVESTTKYIYNKWGYIETVRLKKSEETSFKLIRRNTYNKQGLLAKEEWLDEQKLSYQLNMDYQVDEHKLKLTVIESKKDQKDVRIVCFFNKKGLLIKQIVWDENYDLKNYLSMKKYHYDKKQRLSQINTYSMNQFNQKLLVYKVLFEHNSKGLITKSKHYSYERGGYEGKKVDTAYEYNYNDLDLLILKRQYDSDGSISSEIKLAYDETGRIISQKLYSGEEVIIHNQYKYD